jgi:hypothetical protein
MKNQDAILKPVPQATTQSNGHPSPPEETQERWLHGGVTLEEATRVRAYRLWERAGHPDGDGVLFWLEAEAELLGRA